MKSAVRTNRISGLVLTDHMFDVPLDWANPDGKKIAVFAREVVDPARETEDLPWLVYLQGGPGFPSPRPTAKSGWLKRALTEYRVLLLDQRGTGRSTPATFQTLAWIGSPQEQADYLINFRADAIVRDAEEIRKQLTGADSKWSILGQSFGGFCAVHYLSAAGESLDEVFIAGGLPPLSLTAADVYRATYKRVLDKNRLYYERYPEDRELARRIVTYIRDQEVLMPSGDRMTPRRFQQLGFSFGGTGGFEDTHYLLETAFVKGPDGPHLSYGFLKQMDSEFTFDTNPLFAILHEAIYCQNDASNWAAATVMSEYPEFDLSGDGPVLFTGEMIYPWMFDEYAGLKPLKEAAEILARYDGWPALYDIDTLGSNEVRCAAVAYYNDMYVERGFSDDTAGRIRGLRLWVTSEYEHSGLRRDGEKILDRLIAMTRDM